MKKNILVFFLISLLYSGCSNAELGSPSKYFSKYAELHDDYDESQAVKLSNGQVLLFEAPKSELFDPKTRTSTSFPGWWSINVYVQFPLFTALNNGNILITQGEYGSLDEPMGTILCKSADPNTVGSSKAACPKGKTPLVDLAGKSIRWIDFPFVNLKGHSILVRPDNAILVIGGVLPTNDNTAYMLFQGKDYFKNNVNQYNLSTKKITSFGQLKVPRFSAKAVYLDNNEVLVFGGYKVTSNSLYDSIDPDASTLTSVELINLKKKTSKVIGTTASPVDRNKSIFPLGNGKFLIGETWLQGKLTFEVFDVNHPYSPKTIIGPQDTGEEFNHCEQMPDKNLICLGNSDVRFLNVKDYTYKSIDKLYQPASRIKPFFIPGTGLLIFGNGRILYGYGDKRAFKTIQWFDYEKFLKEANI